MNGKKQVMQKVTWIIIVINLALSIGTLGYLIYQINTAQISGTQYDSEDRYTMYIGTNDKDTYTQLIDTEEARRIVDNICAKYVEGYTRLDAAGGWVDETGTLTEENTLVYMFYGPTQEQLTQIMDEVLVELNQNSILLEKGKTVYTYYYGAK